MPKPNVEIVQGAYSASSISITACEHGTVWVRLHDRAGNVFAVGMVDKGTAIEMGNQLNDAIVGPGFRCDSIH